MNHKNAKCNEEAKNSKKQPTNSCSWLFNSLLILGEVTSLKVKMDSRI